MLLAVLATTMRADDRRGDRVTTLDLSARHACGLLTERLADWPRPEICSLP